MTTKKKPICFIAMAFGHNDCDDLYTHSILPVLKRNDVIPVIINRRQSNDDLNYQIIEQIERADFCISDLTYARPSVYYEAGYAQRSVPVIYTVRKDHLAKGQPEDLRVHFDLQMKPLIDWKSPRDASFAQRLEKRLRATILKEWRKENRTNERERLEIEKFEKLPILVRVAYLRRKAMNSIRNLGFPLSSWKLGAPNEARHETDFPRSWIINGNSNHLVAYQCRKETIFAIAIHAYDSVGVRELDELLHHYNNGLYFRTSEKDYGPKFNRIISNVIILSLKSLSAQRIEKILRFYSVLEKAKTYTFFYEPVASMSVTSTFHFLSSIDSLPHLEKKLQDLLIDCRENMGQPA